MAIELSQHPVHGATPLSQSDHSATRATCAHRLLASSCHVDSECTTALVATNARHLYRTIRLRAFRALNALDPILDMMATVLLVGDPPRAITIANIIAPQHALCVDRYTLGDPDIVHADAGEHPFAVTVIESHFYDR